jgi:hypothetical protein
MLINKIRLVAIRVMEELQQNIKLKWEQEQLSKKQKNLGSMKNNIKNGIHNGQ